MHLQTTHNSTTASLQRELDTLRQSHQQLKIQLRELELGNDDLERNERAVTSSLADVEAKYSRALEEKILIEHELMDKANLEEEFQRLKDELRGKPSALFFILMNRVWLTSSLRRCQHGGISSERSAFSETFSYFDNGFIFLDLRDVFFEARHTLHGREYLGNLPSIRTVVVRLDIETLPTQADFGILQLLFF